jgi:steroid delta-isomerase-like uncharacterized protein
MATEANKAIILRYIEQLNRRNDAVIGELVAEDVMVDTLPAISVDASGPLVGRDVVGQGYQRNTTAFPDYQVTVEQLIAEGNNVVMHWTHRGTHTGDFLGVPPTGREIRERRSASTALSMGESRRCGHSGIGLKSGSSSASNRTPRPSWQASTPRTNSARNPPLVC